MSSNDKDFLAKASFVAFALLSAVILYYVIYPYTQVERGTKGETYKSEREDIEKETKEFEEKVIKESKEKFEGEVDLIRKGLDLYLVNDSKMYAVFTNSKGEILFAFDRDIK